MLTASADRTTYEAKTREADALAFWKDFVQLRGGIFWHCTDSREQDLVGLVDCLCLLPREDGSTLLLALEIKCGRDRLRAAQLDAITLLAGLPDAVVAVVRYGRKERPRWDNWPELSQDETVKAIEEALACH